MFGVILYITITIFSIGIASKVAGSRAFLGATLETEGKGNPRGTRQYMIDRICMCGLLVLLAGVSALRIYTGNDYQTYINHFHDIVCGNYVVTEPGFNLVVTAIYGFFEKEYYLVVFGLFAVLTVAVFLRAMYRQSVDFVTTFYLFMTLGIYFQTFNTVRYYFALAIVLYGMGELLRKNYLSFVFLVLIAALFHKTALVVLPLYLLAYIPWKKWMYVLAGCASLTGLFWEDEYMQLFIRLYPSYVNEEEYLASGGFSPINIIRCIGVLAFSFIVFYCVKKNDHDGDEIEKNKDAKKIIAKQIMTRQEMEFYFRLNLGALVLYTCFSFVPFLSRIGYYLSISHIFFLPALLMLIENCPKNRKIWRYLIWGAGILYFLIFLYKASAMNVRILPYSSWLWKEGYL